MNIILGIWETPMTSYLIIYVALGAIGFLAGYLHRYLVGVVVPIIIWFAISDFQDFYRYNIRPNTMYVFQVTLSMIMAVMASAFGAVLQRRRAVPFR